MGNFIEWKTESNCYIKTQPLRIFLSQSAHCAIGAENGSKSQQPLKGDVLPTWPEVPDKLTFYLLLSRLGEISR